MWSSEFSRIRRSSYLSVRACVASSMPARTWPSTSPGPPPTVRRRCQNRDGCCLYSVQGEIHRSCVSVRIIPRTWLPRRLRSTTCPLELQARKNRPYLRLRLRGQLCLATSPFPTKDPAQSLSQCFVLDVSVSDLIFGLIRRRDTFR